MATISPRAHLLVHLLSGTSTQGGIAPTFPALKLQAHPPRRTIGIREPPSWSCHHGGARWADVCPCMPGTSTWKREIRGTLNELAARPDTIYLETLRPYIADPWELRLRLIHWRRNGSASACSHRAAGSLTTSTGLNQRTTRPMPPRPAR